MALLIGQRAGVIAALVLGAACAASGPAARGSTPLKQAIADLDGPDYAVREAARDHLSADPGVSLADLEAALRSDGLSPEQRARLMSAAYERFARGPRAALGVQFAVGGNAFGGEAEEAEGIPIGRVFPNFPSAAVLRAGDRIVEVVGEPVRLMADSSASFRPLVISRDPGEVVKIKLEREGRTLDVEVALGRFSDLPNERRFGGGGGGGLSGSDIAAGWAVRSAGYANGWVRSAPIVAPLTREEWGMAGGGGVRLMTREGAAARPVSVMAGGRARGPLEGSHDYDEAVVVRGNVAVADVLRRRGGGGRGGGMGGGGGGGVPGPGVVVQLGPRDPAELAAVSARRREIQTRMADVRAEMRTARQTEENQALPAETRAAAREDQARLLTELATLLAQEQLLNERARGVRLLPARP